MSDYIPLEIQMEIMKRFPVKTLFQFRSVSKTWKSIIDSSQFTADYNACKTRPPRLLIRYKTPTESKQIQCLSIVDDDIFPQNKFSHHIPITFDLLNELELIGSSRGLMCFMGGDYPYPVYEMAIIWNPSIKKSVWLFVPALSGPYATNVGFGVCPKTNDPMLVKILNVKKPSKVEIYRLSSRNWIVQTTNIPRQSIRFTWTQVAVDGYICWHAYEHIHVDGQERLHNLIMSFDMISEDFTEVKLPYELAFGTNLSLSKSGESLVLLQYHREPVQQVHGVWMMEHGVPTTFRKLYNINTSNLSLKDILGFRKTRELILEKKMDDSENLAGFEVNEPYSQRKKDLGIYGEVRSLFVDAYTESLILLDEPDCSDHCKI